jgi:hypothetical protein
MSIRSKSSMEMVVLFNAGHPLAAKSTAIVLNSGGEARVPRQRIKMKRGMTGG